MGVIGKTFAFIMFPLSILIVLEQLNVYSLALPLNKVYIGAALMIALQIITLMMLKANTHEIRFMNMITALVFTSIAALAIFSVIFNLFQKEITLILAIVMFVEALYALH